MAQHAFRGFVCGVATAIAASGAVGSTIALSAVHRGWYALNLVNGSARTNDQPGLPTNNYFVGVSEGIPPSNHWLRQHNYFVWDVSGVTEPVKAARLRIFSAEFIGSKDESEDVAFFGFDGDVHNLVSGEGDRVATYEALGAATELYTRWTATWHNQKQFIELELSAEAVADINDSIAATYFVLAGRLMSGPDLDSQGAFGGSTGPAIHAVLLLDDEPPVACPSDLDGDEDVDWADLNILLGQFGSVGDGLSADFDEDGDVDFGDLVTLLVAFSIEC